MYCTNCGAELKDGSKFCTSCGARLDGAPGGEKDVSPGAGAPDQTVARSQPATSVTPPLDARAKAAPVSGRPGKRRGLVAVAVTLSIVAVAAVVVVAGLLTDWFGLAAAPASEAQPEPVTASESETAPQAETEPETEPAEPTVRAAVSDYSWEELSQISALISSASGDAEALDVAVRYHLCNADGTLDGTQIKQLTLTDGTTVDMMVAGFNHDERADGSGTAGITFVSRQTVADHAMNADDSTGGGWRDSDLRAWMNGDLLAQLPADLAPYVVTVSKRTNAVGQTSDPSSVVATDDALWTLAYAEIGGHMDIADDTADEVYNAEGEQYQLYADLGVSWDTANGITAIPGVERWWERSPDPMDGRYFMCVGDDGTPWYAHTPKNEFGVVLCFCV